MILLLSLGGPRSDTEIPFFLKNLTGRTPTPAFLADAARRYEAIGGFSPLPAITEELAQHVTSRMNTMGESPVKAAFLYAHPTIAEAVLECKGSRVAEILFFVLSPFYTTRTTGTLLKAAEEALSSLSSHYTPVTRFVHSWYSQPPFIEWWAKEVRSSLQCSRKAFPLFSAHSMPAAPENSLYRSQVEEAVGLVADRADVSSYALAWQSKPQRAVEEWFGPTVEQLLSSLADRGTTNVVQIPIGFLIENLETLYDIDIVHKRYAEGLGLGHQRLPCPNADSIWADALSSILSSLSSSREIH